MSTADKIPPFLVHKVQTGKLRPALDEKLYCEAWSKLGKRLLKCSQLDKDLPAVAYFDSPNLFAVSVHAAFDNHYPLKINPNVIWLTIAQGFASYVNANAESLRSKFVSFEGKKEIRILGEGFTRDHSRNNWEAVFPNFSKQITEFVGEETSHLIESNFSNSTPTDRIASHITLMDAMKQYFTYVVYTCCGIPYIELLGVLGDWQLIRQKAEGLLAYCTTTDPTLKNWLAELLPVLDHFVLAAEGKPDIAFWGSICNLRGGSRGMGAPLSGWIQVFFPYTTEAKPGQGQKPDGKKLEPNYCMQNWRAAYEDALKHGVGHESGVLGLPLKQIPSGMARAPVRMEWDHGEPSVEDYEFYGGLAAMHQHADGALEVRTGWGVVEAAADGEGSGKVQFVRGGGGGVWND